MEDTFTMIIGIGIAIVLMCVVPLMTLADRSDDIAQLSVQEATTDFVDTIRRTGKITRTDFENFVATINSTGNATYDIELDVAVMDPTSGKKSEQGSTTIVGENEYWHVYTNDIQNQLNTDDVYYLKTGDIISVKVKNSSPTAGQTISGIFAKITGNDAVTIAADASGTVITNGTNTTSK